MDALETALNIAGIGLGVGGGAAGALGAIRLAWRWAGTFGAGNDLARLQIEANVKIAEAQAQAAAANAAAQAAAQPRSYSLHYAPHNHTTATTPASLPDGGGGAGATPGAQPLPGVVDLADLGHRPTAQTVLLGLGPGGKPITVPARDLMHVALLGATGGGKSNTIRLLTAQLLAIGSNVSILDPHFAVYDPETGEDWRAIAARATIASDASAIDEQLRHATDMLDERIALRSQGTRPGTPITFVVDELPVILANVRGAMDSITRVLREGRKVGVFFVGASQDMLVKTLGGGGAVRDNLRTAYYAGGDPHSASVLLDMSRRDLGAHEGDLGRGVVLLRHAASTTPTRARVPLASNAGIAALLGDGAGATIEIPRNAETANMASEKAETGAGEHDFTGAILRLRKSGMGKKRIIETLWGCKPGSSSAYQTASKIYDQAVSE